MNTVTNPSPESPARCGLIAIAGRPNVGKSTLLNALVGQKISITSRKPQTTRHRVMGVRCVGDEATGGAQFVFVDTPGFQTRRANALNRNLQRTVHATLADVDLVLFVVEAGRFGMDDATALAAVPEGKPTLLVANKLDRVHSRAELAPWLRSMSERRDFTEYVPLSAHKGADAQRLLAIVSPHLPLQPWLYDADTLTDRNDRFLAAEIVREKIFRLTGDEVPYGCTVVVESYEEEGALRRIEASIVVDRDSHKGMIIGQGGEHLKRIGTEARVELERLLDAKVHLQLWVRVKRGWADEDAHLRSYGYE